jgi:hypothetical protein
LQEKLVANLHGMGIHSAQWLDYVC